MSDPPPRYVEFIWRIYGAIYVASTRLVARILGRARTVIVVLLDRRGAPGYLCMGFSLFILAC